MRRIGILLALVSSPAFAEESCEVVSQARCDEMREVFQAAKTPDQLSIISAILNDLKKSETGQAVIAAADKNQFDLANIFIVAPDVIPGLDGMLSPTCDFILLAANQTGCNPTTLGHELVHASRWQPSDRYTLTQMAFSTRAAVVEHGVTEELIALELQDKIAVELTELDVDGVVWPFKDRLESEYRQIYTGLYGQQFDQARERCAPAMVEKKEIINTLQQRKYMLP